MKYDEWKAAYVDKTQPPRTTPNKTRVLKNQTDSGILVLGGEGMTSAGASGAIPRNDYKRLEDHANLFYDEVRKRTGDIEKIAHNTGFSVEDVKKIKDHMFFNKYDLDRNEPSRFDPDYDQSVSWQRLSEGKNIQEMDIVMLKHEIMEYGLMVEQGMSYREAHDLTELEYSYSKYVKELDKKGGSF